MKISVIMSVYDESVDQLQKSIGSILNQTFTEFEFIIVLDEPDNLEARKYISDMKAGDDRIIFLENNHNIKLGASLNRGIKIANGKYISRMDGDDICDRTKLKKQFNFLENNTNVDLLFTGWSEVDEKGNKYKRIPIKNDFKNINKTFFYKSPILHASMMCKNEIFSKYMYPEIDRPEDFSLFLELIKSGYIFDVLEEDLYTFNIQDYDIDTKYKKIKIFSSNFLKILFKNIGNYWNNIFFWWMFILVIIQWILSRNRIIFGVFFGFLQRFYKLIFIG